MLGTHKTLEIYAPRSRSLFLNSRLYVRSVAPQLIRSLKKWISPRYLIR